MRAIRGLCEWIVWPAAAVCMLSLPMVLLAKPVTWSGGDFTWSQPDSDSFGAGVTYESGDDVSFLGSGLGTITVAPGGVTPVSMTIVAAGYVFAVSENDALGTGPITVNYAFTTSYTNTLGSEVTLANSFYQPNGGNTINFRGGDFRLTGVVNVGNNGVSLAPFIGVTMTIVNGVTGTGPFSLTGAGKLKLLAASTIRFDNLLYGTVEVFHDQALGSGGEVTTSTGASLPTLIAGGSHRTIARNFLLKNLYVDGTNDLTLSGSLKCTEGNKFVKNGVGTLILAGDNTNWVAGGDYLAINTGVVRLAHANALGYSNTNSNYVVFSGGAGGVLELGASDFTRPVAYAARSILWSGGNGGFSAYGGNRVVNLGGAGATLTWNSGFFVPNSYMLLFGSANANAQLDFKNAIALGGSVRTIHVYDNPNSTADRAVLSGILSGTAGNGLVKTGAGTLFFNAANTYTGATTVSSGSVGGKGSLSGSLVFSPNSGFVADWSSLETPLTVAGTVNIGNPVTLTVLGTPPAKTRTVILTSAGGITGTFGTMSGLNNWTVDYSVAGQVALKPLSGGTLISIR